MTNLHRSQYIGDSDAEYLLSQIGGGDSVRVKRALQDTCNLYNHGHKFKPQHCGQIEVTTVGQLVANKHDDKVRRWCLNLLAIIGTPEKSGDAINSVIESHSNNPDMVASALTAFFKVSPNPYQDLSKRSYLKPQLITLAAYIGNLGDSIDGDKTTIDIQNEDTPILRTALIAVGLDRAPENLFEPRFRNDVIVKELSKHDNYDVAQYAIWAICEHPDLGVQHLGFKIENINDFPPNIRSWTFRLFAEADLDRKLKHEVIVEGSMDSDTEVRLNLARGIKETWYDGLDEVIIDWWDDENIKDTREEILIHMVRQVEYSSNYHQFVMEQFKDNLSDKSLTTRILAAAQGNALFRSLKKVEIIEGLGFPELIQGNPDAMFLEDLIAQGEGDKLEFKASLNWDFNLEKINKGLREPVVKTIAAFSNGQGGKLLIGVDDNGLPIGLAKDYGVIKGDKDRFEIHLRDILNKYFGKVFVINNLTIRFTTVSKTEICEINVLRGEEPVEVEIKSGKRTKNKKFYVRSGNSSQEMSSTEQETYLRGRFAQ